MRAASISAPCVGGRIELPVMGVFEVRDGRIAVWRDYFDLATVTAAFT